MPRTRIAHIITRLINGGADENTVCCCNWAARQGHDVVLLHGEVAHPEIMAKVHPHVTFVRIPSLVRELSPVSDLKALWDVTRQMRAFKPDIVHTHTSKAGIIGRFAARLAGVPTIVHGVHIVPFENVGRLQRLIYLAAERAAAPLTDAFINVSAGMRDLCLKAGVGRPAQHHVVRSGFDLARFRNASPPADWRELLSSGSYPFSLREKAGMRGANQGKVLNASSSADWRERLAAGSYPFSPREKVGMRGSKPTKVLLMLAAFESRKRHREFLDAFAKVAAKIPDVKLLLAGDGPLRPQIEHRIAAHKLERQVILTGFRNDPERLIALADLCLLTSMREGLPRVIVQYLAGGKPCIATDLPGLEEVLRDGENGVITPADDLAATAETAADLLSDRPTLARLTEGALRTDLSAWDAAQMCAHVEAVYAALQGASPHSRPALQRNINRQQLGGDTSP
jgi:glycosyltransferase involved in cell wall biosynthesis